MNWSIVADIIKMLAAVVAGLIALRTYRRSVRTKRAEWLASLHEKFFETDRYARIRRVLDYRQEPDYSALAEAVTAEKHVVLADELYRYLNFFELLASLRLLGEISDNEIIGLFEYDLRLVGQHPFLVRALRVQGFERLDDLLRTLRLLPSPPRDA